MNPGIYPGICEAMRLPAGFARNDSAVKEVGLTGRFAHPARHAGQAPRLAGLRDLYQRLRSHP